MRLSLILGLGMALLSSILPRGGLAQAPGGAQSAKAGRPKDGLLKPYGSRDIRNFTAQKAAYRRPTSSPTAEDKRSRAAVFARGVSDYYPAARANQSKNSNVVDPRTLCVPGRRALLQR